MGAQGARLGIDFGTSNTVAVLQLPGRDPRPLLFDGSPLLPSAVCADPAGRLLVGRDALHTSIATPETFEPFPKRCIDDETVLLGDRQVAVSDLIATALRRVVAEVAVVTAEPVVEAVLTCPAAWGARRRGTLLAAAQQVLPTVRLVTEPVAAASFFVEVAGSQVPPGRYAVVYDFGAGTFDASLVRRTATGFETVAAEGLPDAGGLDIDAAIVDRIGATVGARDPDAWQRLLHPVSAADRRASRQLWDNVRAGKEMLSRATTTLVHVPLLEAEAPVGREELEQIAAPILDRTVAAVRAVLARAGVGTGEVAAVFLAGGSSRIPAVATLLHRALGIRPTIVEQPELSVAEGSLRTVESATVEEPTTAAVGLPPAVPAPTAPGRRRLQLVVVAVLTLALLSGASIAAALAGGDDPGRTAGASPSPTPSPTPSASPTPDPFPVDACMVGTWRSTNRQQFNRIDGEDVQLSGGAGVVSVTHPDGTFTTTFTGSKDMVATVDGVRWTERLTGSVSGNVTHRDGVEYVTNTKARGKASLYRNGRLNNSIPLALLLDGTRYACSPTKLRYFGDGFAAEYVRVS